MKSKLKYGAQQQSKLTDKRWLGTLLSRLADLSPAYFSLVMATGIISIAVHLYHWVFLSKGLFWLNLIAYILLCVLFIARYIFYRSAFHADYIDDRKSMGFLSFTAASCILGNQFLLIYGSYKIAIFFLVIGSCSWLFLSYSLFAVLIEKRQKPTLKAINGTWLLLIVSTQSLSVLSALLATHFPLFQEQILFCSLTLFLCGCMFYILIITLILHRLIFFEISAAALGTPYWINMGADAISVLAGATLILHADKWTLLTAILPFLKGFTLLYWAIGTWWIPLMIVLGAWRHIVKHIPIKYDSQYWGMVFPLGMYTVSTFQLSEAISLPFLMGIPALFVIIALAVWCIVFASMISFLSKLIKVK